jgi:hypothetical protein
MYSRPGSPPVSASTVTGRVAFAVPAGFAVVAAVAVVASAKHEAKRSDTQTSDVHASDVHA